VKAARIATVLLASIVLSAGASAHDRKCPPSAQPDWAQIPSGHEFARYYPERTDMPPNTDGHVTLDCVADRAI
jgi:hypothetical protein